jgi:phospholipase C
LTPLTRTSAKILAWIFTAALCACSSPLASGPSAPGYTVGQFGKHNGGTTPIQHVIVIMQENRSFNNLFYGFPGAKTAKTGKGHGTKYKLQEIPLEWRKFDLNHSHEQFLEDYDKGNDDGWDAMIVSNKQTGPICGSGVNRFNEPTCWVISKSAGFKQMAFSYVQQSDITPYWDMAKQYALGDDTFSSNNGPTFVSHQYLVAGQSGHSVEVPTDLPWGCDADKSNTVNLLAYGPADPPVFSAAAGHEKPGPFPCFTYSTIVSALDTYGITWKYYTQGKGSGSNLDPFEANEPIWTGPDRANIISPDTVVLTDIANGNLPQVSWVTPSGLKSDHPGPQSGNKGPSWVASIVNAVGESPYWNSTAIIIMWDEWGGWFDPVNPKQYPDPVTKAHEGLGFRVPLIVVSPYAKAGYVSHSQHEIASTLHFIEQTFGLPPISNGTSSIEYADQRADAFDDIFDFTQPPIPFVPISSPNDARYFLTHPDNTPGDTY